MCVQNPACQQGKQLELLSGGFGARLSGGGKSPAGEDHPGQHLPAQPE